MNRTGKALLAAVLFAAKLVAAQSCTVAPASGPGCSFTNDIVTWSNTSGVLLADPAAFQIVGTTGTMSTMQANNPTQSLIIQGGQDGTAYQNPYGGIIIRGATMLNGGTTGGAGGSVVVQGGDNFADHASVVTAGGWLMLRPGAATGTVGDSVPGHLVISQTFREGSSYTCPDPTHPSGGCRLACITGHDTVNDCSNNPANNYVGVELPPVVDSTRKAANVQVSGYTEVLAASTSCLTWAIGDIVCVDPSNAGFVIDNGTNLCATTTPPTNQVGIVALAGCAIDHQVHFIVMTR